MNEADFASAAMLRLVRIGMQRQGIALAAIPAKGPLVPFTQKRALLTMLSEKFGLDALLHVGDGLQAIDKEPTLAALCAACTPLDLVQRWQRLERYVHFQHRIVVIVEERDRLVLRHVSRAANQAPLAEEDVLVFGVLTALFERIGDGRFAVQARIAGERNWRRRRGQWRVCAWPDDASSWEFRWSENAHAAHTIVHRSPHDDAHHRARALIEADPSRKWSVAELAQRLTLSPRTLQRYLRDADSSFTSICASARATCAAHLLIATQSSFSEIGFICGYADQAHFNREFKRATALTPLKYRSEFSARV
jgi:AraC-like DNA-binding protein